MPRLKNSVPKYRLHKPSGRAVVTLAGRDHYLGKHGTKASKAAYHRLIAEWEAGGRPSVEVDEVAPTVNEIVLAYWKHVEVTYVKNGKPTDEQSCIRSALAHLRALHGQTEARKFGPLALKAVRQRMIDADNSRRYINKQVLRIRQMFRWAVENELVPSSVYEALRAVAGLRKGKSEAKERPPVESVSEETIQATLVELDDTLRAMIRFQRLTGCRPGEVRLLRPCEVERKDSIWLYRPGTHKTEHFDRGRVIPIGPQAQDVLRPYLLRAEDSYCFQPSDRSFRDHYTKDEYCNRIQKAAKRAGACKWAPNQLRHSAATAIRKRFGLEAAQVVLGHSKADVTQVYAERDLTLAVQVAREVG